MTDLLDFRVTDGVTEMLAAQYNRVIDSTFRGELTNVETLSANKTLTDNDYPFQVLNANGANRDVTLPAVAASNHVFVIYNSTAATYTLTVKNAGGTTLNTISPSYGATFYSTGSTWYYMADSLPTNVASLASLTGAANNQLYFSGVGTLAVSPGIWINVRKTADQTKTSDAVAGTDTLLQFSMAANTKYAIRGRIFWVTTANADFRFRWLSPASPTAFDVFINYLLNATPLVEAYDYYTAVPGAATVLTSASAIGGYMELEGSVQNGANAGTFAFSWAQGTSHGDSTIVRAGSWLSYMVSQ